MPSGEQPERPQRPQAPARYSLYVGLIFAALVLVAVVNAISSDGGGIAGVVPDADRGVPIAEFAVPDVRSDLEGDANVDQDDCKSARNPCPEAEVRRPACRIEVEGAIRVCDLFDKPLAISFWFTRGGDCLPSQDSFDAVAAQRSREVNFLSVNVRDGRERVEEIVAERRWRLAVGHDADGAVSNLLDIGVCPSIVLAYPGGIIHGVEIKPDNYEPAEIEAMVDELLAASREREGQRL